MDADQLYDGLGIQKFYSLYHIDSDPGHPWAELQDAPGLIQAGVVFQWASIQIFVAPARQVVKGVFRVGRAVRTTQTVVKASRADAKTPTKAAPKKFDMFAEKYYRLPPSKRFTERRKDLYESSSPMERELLQMMWALERQSSNFNPSPWILAMFGGSAYFLAWAWLVGHRL